MIATREAQLKAFIQQVYETLLWSETDGDDPLDKNYTIEDLSQSAKRKIKKDCKKFYKFHRKQIEDFNLDITNVAHDFWLTRQETGAGFDDGDYVQDAEDIFMRAIDHYERLWIYVGDDKKIYIGGHE